MSDSATGSPLLHESVYRFDKSKPLCEYNSNRDALNQFIDKNFDDCDMIDYRQLQPTLELLADNLSSKEAVDQKKEESARLWSFISNCIFAKEVGGSTKYQDILKNLALFNQKRRRAVKQAEFKLAQAELKKQIHENNLLMQGVGQNSLLMSTDEVNYQQALSQLHKAMLDYYHQMDRGGFITLEMKQFLKQGVMFKLLKTMVFAIRKDVLDVRLQKIKRMNAREDEE